MLDKIRRRPTKLIPGLIDLRHEEGLTGCDPTRNMTIGEREKSRFLDTKILNGYEIIDNNIVFPKLRHVK